MRRPVVVLALALATLAGCSGICEDQAQKAGHVADCQTTGAPRNYCTCAVQQLMERYTCTELEENEVTFKDVSEACEHCGGAACNVQEQGPSLGVSLQGGTAQ